MFKSVLFVCLGNICRSPTAEGIFRSKIKTKGFKICHDSAGLTNWHQGQSPYEPMQNTCEKHGYNISDLKARIIKKEDYRDFDWILAMDDQNIDELKNIYPSDPDNKIRKITSFIDGSLNRINVPDPYYTGDYEASLNLIEQAVEAFLNQIFE